MSAYLRPPDWSRRSCRDAASWCGDGSRSAAVRGSRHRRPSRSRSSRINETPMHGERGSELGLSLDAGDTPAQRTRGTARTLIVLLAAALALGACSGDRFIGEHSSLMAVPPRPATLETQASPAALREHQRILAAYGGAYEDAKLEAQVGAEVDRLVAASERPDVPYKVTILNSSAVNAFALPTGQLYVTRGLLALASDTSELASVLSHEMAHVIARHASIREDQARQAAVVTRVVTDMSNDPDLTALALAKTKLTMASFSRQQ